MTDIKAFLEAGDEDSLEIAREIQAELREAAQSMWSTRPQKLRVLPFLRRRR